MVSVSHLTASKKGARQALYVDKMGCAPTGNQEKKHRRITERYQKLQCRIKHRLGDATLLEEKQVVALAYVFTEEKPARKLFFQQEYAAAHAHLVTTRDELFEQRQLDYHGWARLSEAIAALGELL